MLASFRVAAVEALICPTGQAERPGFRPALSGGGGQRTIEFGSRRHFACS
jgi:hypothetical protein